jgi:hypothetical protein
MPMEFPLTHLEGRFRDLSIMFTSRRDAIVSFRPRRYSTNPNIIIGIPIVVSTPNALELSPNRAVMTPEIHIMDPIRYFQKRNCSRLKCIAEHPI